MESLLTVSEVAKLLRVSSMTVYRMLKNGNMAALRVGKKYRIKKSEINKFIRNNSLKN